ncbi:helveticin [Lactobacillus agrestimuris]|uniref:helveticin n=1 Tax=Lactobacillus agrestimuris TaxID=2941328 RepID=UPI0020448DC1|nr:helveticin [Lactobacillus agrestimuris]
MDIHDCVELITLVLWFISIVGISILSHVHFKNERLEQFRITADDLMKRYVGLYNKESLANDQKINRVVNAVVDGLEAKGFKVEDQDVMDIFAKVAKIINENSSK